MKGEPLAGGGGSVNFLGICYLKNYNSWKAPPVEESRLGYHKVELIDSNEVNPKPDKC